MNVSTHLIDLCRQAIEELSGEGAMPAGHNGPYFHEESALRNTCHWLFSWSVLYRETGDPVFREAAVNALRYVRDSRHRSGGGNWHQRSHPGRDSCNGVIGAAWTGEALWAAAGCLQQPELLTEAVEVLSRHEFDEDVGLWHRWEVDGRTLSIDQTFNHQLWFAATAARCGAGGSPELLKQCARFMDRLEANFEVMGEGLIRHRISLYPIDRLFRSGTPFHFAFNVYRSLKSRRVLMDTHTRDLGYHAFNQIAFAVLHSYFPHHPFWGSEDWRAALSFAQGSSFRKAMTRKNKYAFPYNPVGFEVAAALKVFVKDSEVQQREWMDLQWNELTGGGQYAYGEKAADPVTARARIYEGLEAELIQPDADLCALA